MQIKNKYNQYKEVIKSGQRKTLRDDGVFLPISATSELEIFTVDKGIIPNNIQNQKKCDFFVYNSKMNTSNFIELKTGELEYACDQIHDTIAFFENDDFLKIYLDNIDLVRGYVVSPSKIVPNISNTHVKKTCRKLYNKSKKKDLDLFKYLIFVCCVSKIPGQHQNTQINNRQILVSNNNPLNL